MKIRAYLLALIIFAALSGCNQAWAGDTTQFTTVYDTTPISAAIWNQFIAPINRLERAGVMNFSDTSFDLPSTAYADSSVVTSKIAHQAIDDTCVSDTAGIDYDKVDKNPYMPYARDYQYGSPLVDTTVFQNVRIQFGETCIQGSDTYFTSAATITYPTAFDNTYPVAVFAECVGYNTSADSYTTSVEAQDEKVNRYAITNTSFSFVIRNSTGASMASTNYYFVSWVAIGRKD